MVLLISDFLNKTLCLEEETNPNGDKKSSTSFNLSNSIRFVEDEYQKGLIDLPIWFFQNWSWHKIRPGMMFIVTVRILIFINLL
jgi:hypothetical protein